VVTLSESPFDRRHRMARVNVDTAGAEEGQPAGVPYLTRATAEALHGRLVKQAAQTSFRW
jgi:membrane protein YdbS with pleckstrin-like domain